MARVVDLVSSFLTRTKEGKIKWQEFAGDDLYAEIGANTVLLTRRRDSVGIIINNSAGKTIDTFYPEDWEADQLNALYEIARRQAFRVEETLEDIKKTLDSL